MQNGVERLDKAFEWLVLFLTLMFATFFQWIALVWQKEISEQPDFLTPLVFAIRLFLIPIILTVISWLGKIIIQEQNRKMFFRKFAWIWGMLQLWWYIFLTSILVTLEMPSESTSIAMAIAIIGMLPLSIIFYRRIMNLYKTGLSDIPFWKSRWWDYGTTLIAMVSIVCFIGFIFATLQPIPQSP